MATDITKTNFDPLKHYTSVRMQQGRVLTDDDWNENEQIENEDRRRALVDIIGPFGSPDKGFNIFKSDDPVAQQGNRMNFLIEEGTLYLGGLRLNTTDVFFTTQPDWLQMPRTHGRIPNGPRFDLVYIEAWQQTVTAVEDEFLLEVALGGADTTTRVRNMQRVKILENIPGAYCEDGWEALQRFLGTIDKHELTTDAKLQVAFTTSGSSDDLCSPTAKGGYLGAQNQTIRIQLIDSNHFTWGFDNASTLYKVKRLTENKFRLLNKPKDKDHYPKPGQIVEIIPCSARLANREKIAELSGTLRKVSLIQSDEYTLDLPVDPAIDEEVLYIRIWDRGEDLSSSAAIPITHAPVHLGKTGLQVTITGNSKRKDDFWIISVRPETPNDVIPKEAKTGIAPHGVRRFYAPLAVIRWARSGESMVGTIIHDCRKTFLPLTERRDHCELITPGQDIQAVIDKYDDGEDICICFQNGEYILTDTVNISNKGHIKFTGCGKGSKIIVEQSEAAFKFEGCKDITIRDLSVESRASGHPVNDGKYDEVPKSTFRQSLKGGITVIGCEHVLFENIMVTCKSVLLDKEDFKPKREASCIYVINNNAAISIKNSEFKVGFLQAGILIINPKKVHLENNRIVSIEEMVVNQGIVIAGRHANEVHIKDNTILNVEQGIHIGTSNNKDVEDRDKETGYRIDRSTSVLITGNQVTCILLPPDDNLKRKRREGHGIFVGNCDSLILRDNFIKLDRNRINIKDPITLPINGIRIYGHLGKRIIVRDNHLEGFGYSLPKGKNRKSRKNLGIYIVYLPPAEVDPKWWVVESNITEDIRIEGRGKLFRTAKMIYDDRWRYFGKDRF